MNLQKILQKTIFIYLILISLASNAQTVSLYAGSGYGYLDGSALYAKFSYPYGMVMDSSGNMYIGDSNNHRIRKITPAGVVSTFAGSSVGLLDGTGTAAGFNFPTGLAIDSAGNIYVCDENNCRIRKITPAGVVTHIAGVNNGFVDGPGISAKFSYPRGIAVDATGNLYVTDTYNHKIRKIDTSGNVTTFAGSIQGAADGTGTAAQFDLPEGIVIDSSGNLYITDATCKIRKVTPAGVVTTITGSTPGYNDGNISTAQFNRPSAMALDSSGNIYVTDSMNHKIRKIATDGTVSTVAGSTQGYQNGAANTAKFNFPSSIFLASNSLYVGEIAGNFTIRKITGGTLSIQENLLEEKTNIYPNPVKNILNIQFEGAIKSVEMYNLQGQLVLKSNQLSIDVSRFQNGVYLLKMEDENQNIGFKRFIKE